jgi:ATP-binding cassette subfamily A (ABC1) protein 5
MYFFTYFIVLGGLMIFICAALLGLIFVFDLPALRSPPAFVTLGTLVLLYCPPSILFSTVLSYIFDKTDTAQAILPNVATFFGLIPFSLVALIDMLRLGGRTAFALHTVFSVLNTAYAPYAIVYYVTRVYIACSVNSACTTPTFNDYLTDELIVLFVTIILHIPIWFFALLIVDIKKSGGRARDAFTYLLVSNAIF